VIASVFEGMPSRRLEDRIRELCRSALTANNSDLDKIFSALNSALREHAERLRKLMILKLATKARVATPERRSIAAFDPVYAGGQADPSAGTMLAALWGSAVDTPKIRIPPLARVRSNFQSPTVHCSICGRLVPLEIAKVDEFGSAIHEECYALKMQLKSAISPSAA
jgi:hypothetical protein